MARTHGHVYHRYEGFKAILAEHAARKAALVTDRGHEIDVQPFWMDAPCCCMRLDCAACGEEAQFWADYDARHERRPLEQRPEPEVKLTGKIIAVEWEYIDGGRWWSNIDEGRLDWEVWRGLQIGVYLSDVDELAVEAA